jgi:very-short-patch-repair endonuclease
VSISEQRKAGLWALEGIARRQHGLFTAEQARSVGISPAMIKRLVSSGELVVVDYGVYASVLTPPSWHQQLLAVCLASPAAASHRSAGALWRTPDLRQVILEVTAVRHLRRSTQDVVWHESYFLDDRDVTEIDGIPVTSATRTVLDLAAVLDDDHLIRVLDDMLRRRLTSIEKLGKELERMGPRRPGAKRMRAVLKRRIGIAVPESDLETVFDSLLRRHGLPEPQRQIWVHTDLGDFRMDFGYQKFRIGMEPMGSEFHAGRWEEDMARLAALAAMDWQMLAFSDFQVRNREQTVVRAVRGALARAGHQFDDGDVRF